MEYVLENFLKQDLFYCVLQGASARLFWELDKWNVVTFSRGKAVTQYSGDSLGAALVMFQEIETE
jgi:hypothetical protein